MSLFWGYSLGCGVISPMVRVSVAGTLLTSCHILLLEWGTWDEAERLDSGKIRAYGLSIWNKSLVARVTWDIRLQFGSQVLLQRWCTLDVRVEVHQLGWIASLQPCIGSDSTGSKENWGRQIPLQLLVSMPAIMYLGWEGSGKSGRVNYRPAALVGSVALVTRLVQDIDMQIWQEVPLLGWCIWNERVEAC